MTNNISNDDSLTNKILVIGNGFDLALGYKTSYNDISEFIINNKIKGYKDKPFYKEFKQIVDNNKFIRIFNGEKKLWSDVEDEIRKIIDSIKKLFDKDFYEYKKLDLSNYYYVVNKQLSIYDMNVLSKFEIVVKQYSIVCLSEEYINGYGEVDKQKVIDYVKKELNALKRIFIIYLKDIVPEIYDKYKKYKKVESAKRVNDIKTMLENIKPELILSFNYTDFCKNINNNIPVFHVHGDLVNENIVLGYEEDNSNEYSFEWFKKSFQIKQNDIEQLKSDSKFFNQIDLHLYSVLDGDEEKAKLDNEIHCFGLSFGQTDRDYTKLFFSLDRIKKIVIYCKDKEDRDNKRINLYTSVGENVIKTRENNKTIEFVVL